jgi:hypothetical protein
MRLGGEPVGRWGIALLAVAALVGVLLGWHGWTGRAAAVAPSLAGGTTSGTPAPAPSGAAPATQGPSASPAAASPPASPASSPAVTSSSAHVGPALSSEPFASSAFQIWPGPVSAAAKAALTGLTISVHKERAGLSVVAGVNGQPPAAPHLYVGGVRVYVVEASMGDDSGNSDYSLGDDGLVVVNAQGRILQ